MSYVQARVKLQPRLRKPPLVAAIHSCSPRGYELFLFRQYLCDMMSLVSASRSAHEHPFGSCVPANPFEPFIEYIWYNLHAATTNTATNWHLSCTFCRVWDPRLGFVWPTSSICATFRKLCIPFFMTQDLTYFQKNTVNSLLVLVSGLRRAMSTDFKFVWGDHMHKFGIIRASQFYWGLGPPRAGLEATGLCC